MTGAEEAANYMQGLLEKLAEFSEPGEGVTRLLYSPEWMQAQQFLLEQIADSGLEGYADDVGNVYGELTGSRSSEPIVLTGSHIDTVVSGGRYDGAYGVAAALAALRYLRRTYGPPQRTITAVSFAEEEGSRFPLTFWGSGHVTGLYNVSEAAGCRDAGGVSLQEAMAGCALGPRQPKPPCSGLAAYVELHIEQGIVLEREGTQLGIVSAICGQRRFAAVVRGTANHAGTTPMGLRLSLIPNFKSTKYNNSVSLPRLCRPSFGIPTPGANGCPPASRTCGDLRRAGAQLAEHGERRRA
ncbi:hydantoinase/carbamoylase family amidase [Paenibacillus rubinfantis]|uniref:hydantoinase/carbamoylase family amidase n=1 Tax=Paenibacillus rubinfantis TaxID=1720296 RepID=UPI00073E543B|nr:hydantoinase/carbamoylase family amidase [Paenibacillus rubinfantis]